MKSTTIARNYAEALVMAGEDAGGAASLLERYGRVLDDVAGAVEADERIAVALESPRVAKATKAQLLADALDGVAPVEVVRFLQAIVRRGRQGLLREIAAQFHALLDVKLNRVHAGVTLALPADTRLEAQIITRLAQTLGREVRAHFRVDGGILGGVVVRVGDRVFDGSVRRRLAVLRHQLLAGA
jgi:F-type H+-transporting ATPase subunit delta